jgi:hypothetical protein
MVGAFDGVQFVGAATGTPMEEHADDFAKAFSSTAYALWDIFYCAESVLLSKYRGRGLNRSGFTGDCLVLLKRLYRVCSCLHRTPPLLRLA